MENRTNITFISYFPDITYHYFQYGILRKLQQSNNLKITSIPLVTGKRRIDGQTYGGKEGMILRFDILYDILSKLNLENTVIIHPSASGNTLNNDVVKHLAKHNNFIFICSRYEGIDSRVIKYFNVTEICIGPYILYDGDTSSLVIANCIVRYKYVKKKAHINESFDNYLLEYDQYTKPLSFCGLSVPHELRSGNHKLIQQWKLNNAIQKTIKRNKNLYNLYKQNNDDKNGKDDR